MTDREALLVECAEVCTSGCHADDCEHHGHAPADERGVLHRLLTPPHPGGVYLSSALCSCGEWQFDADSPGDLFNKYRAILREHTAHGSPSQPEPDRETA